MLLVPKRVAPLPLTVTKMGYLENVQRIAEFISKISPDARLITHALDVRIAHSWKAACSVVIDVGISDDWSVLFGSVNLCFVLPLSTNESASITSSKHYRF